MKSHTINNPALTCRCFRILARMILFDPEQFTGTAISTRPDVRNKSLVPGNAKALSGCAGLQRTRPRVPHDREEVDQETQPPATDPKGFSSWCYPNPRPALLKGSRLSIEGRARVNCKPQASSFSRTDRFARCTCADHERHSWFYKS